MIPLPDGSSCQNLAEKCASFVQRGKGEALIPNEVDTVEEKAEDGSLIIQLGIFLL